MGDTSKLCRSEQVVSMRREAEVVLSNGQAIQTLAKRRGIAELVGRTADRVPSCDSDAG